MRNLNWDNFSMGMKAEWEKQVETQLAPRKLVSATDAQYCIQGAICATQDSLMYFRELYQTKQKKALDGPKSPERLVFTKPPQNPGPQYVYQRDKNTGSPPNPYWTMAGIFF